MPVKTVKPTTPGRRQMTIADFSALTKKKPEKALTEGKRRISGRNSSGRVTIRRRGGGHKRNYRLVDFKRLDKSTIVARVAAIEYDPNRSASLALLHYTDGAKRYMIAPHGLRCDDRVVCGERTKVKIGNRMQLKFIPAGYRIHDIELTVGKGGQIVRSAGSSATLVGFDDDATYAIVQLPSGETRKILARCCATIGVVSNPDHNLVRLGKAGRTRWLGRRPKVLGKSMNAVDHPHGGGEGHSPIGLKAPKTPWGKKALGIKTRHKKTYSRSLIIRRRREKTRV